MKSEPRASTSFRTTDCAVLLGGLGFSRRDDSLSHNASISDGFKQKALDIRNFGESGHAQNPSQYADKSSITTEPKGRSCLAAVGHGSRFCGFQAASCWR
jgi:hypothetical protein